MVDRPCTQKEARQLRDALVAGLPLEGHLARVWTDVLTTYQLEVLHLEELCGELPGVMDSTSRVKTRATLAEKLIRLPGQQLLNVDDIGGCRFITSDVVTQDTLVAALVELLTGHGYEIRSKDRRWHDTPPGPSHGYRAVHLIARRGWFRCELQVRTSLQHRWAELFESMCDAWGRGPRYGEPVTNPTEKVSLDGSVDRKELVSLMRETSDECQTNEAMQLRLAAVEDRLSLLGEQALPDDKQLREAMAQWRSLQRVHLESLQRTLDLIASVWAGEEDPR